MKSNITLKALDLSWNGFADEGAMAMGEALKSNNSLTWLDLSYNRITDRGIFVCVFLESRIINITAIHC